jgi:hypothetical protein
MENNNRMMQQMENQTEILLDIIRSLSFALKSKRMSNYFISEIDMLRLISEEQCLYVAERLDKFYLKPVETIKQMTKNFQQFTIRSRMKVPLTDDYSKVKVYTWHLRSLLTLALTERDHLLLQRFEHIVELSNKYFPSSFNNISNVEQLLFTWLNKIITPRLRKNLPECFEQQQQDQEIKNLPWLTSNLVEPIVLVFNIMNMYFDEENNDNTDETDVEDDENDVNAGNIRSISF